MIRNCPKSEFLLALGWGYVKEEHICNFVVKVQSKFAHAMYETRALVTEEEEMSSK